MKMTPSQTTSTRLAVAGFALAAACFVTALTGPTLAQSQSAGGSVITEIEVIGVQRIDADTVRAYMPVKPGDFFDPGTINEALKVLYATGLFTDVTIVREAEKLVVSVEENPVINTVVFEGNDELDTDVLQLEIQLRKRLPFTAEKVQEDVKRLLDLYRRSGYFAASVSPKIIEKTQNRVDLIYEISEGPETKIGEIKFIGNDYASDNDLKDLILSKESRWYRFLGSNDTYDADRITFDNDTLRRFYLNEGFADFRVVSAVAELSPDQEQFFVTFTVEEGARYKIAKIETTSRIQEIPSEDLLPLVEFDSGDWYDSDTVENMSIAITNYASERGFAFVKTEPILTRDRENATIDITFELGEGPEVYIERIDIVNNARTLDSVIRREMLMAEGDAFNSAKLRRSRQRIENLGYFSQIAVNAKPGSDSTKSVVEVKVEEQVTGSLSLGLGYSNSDGGLLDFGLSEQNFLGRGQTLTFGATLSKSRQNYRISFSEPYLFGRELAGGFSIFNVRTDNTVTSSFRSEDIGISLNAGFRYNEEWRQGLRYTLLQRDVTDIEADASLAIQDERGKTLRSIIGQTVSYDTRNSRLSPTKGLLASLSTDIAGLGGDVRYLNTEVRGVYYFQITDGWVLSTSGRVGHILGFGKETSVNDRFFLGGRSLRGFDNAGIGPREQRSEDALGGTKLAKGTVELQFPLGLPEELGISGAIFTDVGTLFDPDVTPRVVSTDAATGVVTREVIESSKSARASIGVGFAWVSALGPLRLDVSKPILKERYDLTETFLFQLGTRF